MDIFDVGIDIAGEGLEVPDTSLEAVEEGLDIPKGLIDILYFIKELYAQKKLENADFTLSDLHTLLASEFTRNPDLQAVAAMLVQSKQDEAKELTLLPKPSVYLTEPLSIDRYPQDIRNPLVLFLDGTGDHYEKEAATNVKVLHSLLSNAYAQWKESLLYFQGIGVGDTLDYVFAFSLPDKVKSIYRALCQHWTPGRDLVIFGFSRGAFTARAVCGLLGHCGVLKRQVGESLCAVSDERVSDIVDRFLSTPWAESVSLSLADDERQFRSDSSDPAQRLVVQFLGLFDTVPGIPVAETLRYRHTMQHFQSLVCTSCHIQAHDNSFLFENVSLHTDMANPRRNASLCVSPSNWTDLEAVRAFVSAKRHLEFRHCGEHSNIGGGWEFEKDRVSDVRCISNSTLRLMLLASPFRDVVPLLDARGLFPVPRNDEELNDNVKSNLHYRDGLNLVEKIQIIAMNMIELLCVDRKAKNTTIVAAAEQQESSDLSEGEKQAVRESVRKNLDAFNVTGELLKFLKAIVDAHNERMNSNK